MKRGNGRAECLLPIWREFDCIDWFLEVEMMQHHCTYEIYKKGSSIYSKEVNLANTRQKSLAVPSSTLIKTFESGLRAITAMFFRFSNGRV